MNRKPYEVTKCSEYIVFILIISFQAIFSNILANSIIIFKRVQHQKLWPFRNRAVSQLFIKQFSKFLSSKTFPINIGSTHQISAHLIKFWRHSGSLKLPCFMLFYLIAKNFGPRFWPGSKRSGFLFCQFQMPLG